MKVLQSLLVLFFALAIQVLTSVAKKPKTQTPAIQTPTTATPVSYKPGTMIRVKSSAWEKKKDRNKNSDIPHFGVVVGQNTRNKKYKIVHISANLPAKYNHRDDASKYHPNAKKKNNKINTGRPELVAHKHLQPANANDGWGKMEDKKLLALQTLINKNHPSANLRTGNHGLGRSSQPKSNQNGPKGKSRQFQGKKPRPRPIQSTRGKGLKLRSVQVNVP